MPSNARRARKRRDERKKRMGGHRPPEPGPSGFELQARELKKRTGKLQGHYAVKIHGHCPPLLLELRDNEPTAGGWDGYRMTGGFFYKLAGCTTLGHLNFYGRMSMSEFNIYDGNLFKAEIIFEYDLVDAINVAVPTRVIIDYDFVLVPRINAGGRRWASGRLIVENNCITNNKMVHVRDTLWSQGVKFKPVSSKQRCIEGRGGIVFMKMMMVRAVIAFDPLGSEGILHAMQEWCKKNEGWIETHWFFSKAGRLIE